MLGRAVEEAGHRRYGDFVRDEVLAPLNIHRMQLGHNLYKDRKPGEVTYYDSKNRTGRAISGPDIGKQVPLPYGVECIETMDANGGWVASAPDLLRFASQLDHPKHCKLLKLETIRQMLSRPKAPVSFDKYGKPEEVFYACGWYVRPSGDDPDRCTKWHTGLLAGSNSLLVCREDGIDWVVLFNSDGPGDGTPFDPHIDPLLHNAANQTKEWPQVNKFVELYGSG